MQQPMCVVGGMKGTWKKRHVWGLLNNGDLKKQIEEKRSFREEQMWISLLSLSAHTYVKIVSILYSDKFIKKIQTICQLLII